MRGVFKRLVLNPASFQMRYGCSCPCAAGQCAAFQAYSDVVLRLLHVKSASSSINFDKDEHTWSHMTENARAMRDTSLCLILIHSDAQRISVQGYAALRPFNQISTLSCSGGVQAYLLISDAATALHQTVLHQTAPCKVGSSL